jgi:hypothetical protein
VEGMGLKKIFGAVAMMFIMHLGFSHALAADELIVVSDDPTREAALNWFGFLEIKEIPYQVVSPETFKDHQRESYIVIMGDIENNMALKKIASQALSAGELKSIGEKKNGDTFFKSNVWAPKQNVILFLGIDQASVDKARKASRENWYSMFIEWFDIESPEGLYTY